MAIVAEKTVMKNKDFSTAKWEASFGMSSHDNNSLGLFGSLRTQARDGASSNLNQDLVDEGSLAREEKK
ncbi:hypothetical protein JHK87_053522 [Glycine soja]|nr:hypothetical protein JHK87_053522 [Glycine soja]